MNEFMNLPWDELVGRAREALQARDVETMKMLDAAFQHFFLHEAQRGSRATRTDFIRAMLAIVESEEARQVTRPEPVQQFVLKCEHLDVLMDAIRQQVDPVEEAERLVQSRDHGEELLRRVKAAGPQGIRARELADALGIRPQHLSRLLREFEARDIVERHPAGQNVYVCLGLAGQLVAERREAQAAVPVLVLPAEADMFWQDSNLIRPPASAPRQWLM